MVRHWLFARSLLVLAGLALVPSLQAANTDIVKVEEDWELVVREPDVDSNAPQITCVISPSGNLSGAYAAFDVNHRSQPSYSAGGLQLQLWSGDHCTATSTLNTGDKLHSVNETVRWTTRMYVWNNSLRFQVRNGTSDAWGSFGGISSRLVSSQFYDNVNGYTSAVSVAQSGVGFAGNRVTSLKLLKVRRYQADGTVVEDNEVKVVHQGE